MKNTEYLKRKHEKAKAVLDAVKKLASVLLEISQMPRKHVSE